MRRSGCRSGSCSFAVNDAAGCTRSALREAARGRRVQRERGRVAPRMARFRRAACRLRSVRCRRQCLSSTRGQHEDVDVLSVGADPRRDFGLLLGIATRHPELTFRIVAVAERMRAALADIPSNVAIETDIPLERVRDRFAAGALCRAAGSDNSYSGATTVLLQAMAMGKPVIVSRTAAIAEGYELEDGVNCRLVKPGDARGAGARGPRNAYGRGCRTFSRHPRPRNGGAESLVGALYTNALWRIFFALGPRP